MVYWLWSDPHFGHAATFDKFKRDDGTPLRPFSSVEEMNETMIANHNDCVRPHDTVYVLGDIAINKKYLPLVNRLNGKKRLIMGNHDVYGYKEYVKYFDDIMAYKVFEKDQIICSHIPLSIDSRARFRLNIHGHTHANCLEDDFYYNVCVEQLDYKPIMYDDILKYLNLFLKR